MFLFFSDIQIHEAVILNPSNVFDFIFQQYFVTPLTQEYFI